MSACRACMGADAVTDCGSPGHACRLCQQCRDDLDGVWPEPTEPESTRTNQNRNEHTMIDRCTYVSPRSGVACEESGQHDWHRASRGGIPTLKTWNRDNAGGDT